MASDPAVLDRLHREHATALWNYVVRLTGDRVAAQDVVQETMLRAWRQGITDDDHQRATSARAWLFTVARHLVIDEARSARHRREFPTDELPEGRIGDQVDAVFDAALVSDALGTLPMIHREVVVRAYYGRATAAEIAEDLGLPVGTVKSRLHYGLRALRLALQERGVTR
ncbi:sigma-70 family RNA polymerase sigma factor [Calidifontibacter sp. DB0510]|uniref:Sigma-70 family RNA polymerase sigma factor n=1 Tax=Metallococcus carri TaxID=1656884 RepID=A0A967B8E5_9MICO|nr:sigma-70 family RNA polymerase sigma factor [Metallococcus carri]NHN56681.1 sigma-70 family RNA polymerase sigma factor [Metallococcus carri]NOP38980.1 sigma-70 family RNA polymerase sigma factor [Calidifontibacter sp. DB2511S]